MSDQGIEDGMLALVGLCRALKEALTEERRALAERDADALHAATQNKQTLCQQIDDAMVALGPTPLGARIDALPAAAATEARALHATLKELVEDTRAYNTANGKILHRSAQSVRELINLLAGAEDAPVYAPNGQAGERSTRSAIAKA